MTFQEFKEQYQKKEVKEIAYSVTTNPMVSVLVQTYQQKDFIRECLDSLLIQETTFDFEILIGDDGSIDGTREICREYVEKHPDRIRLFLHHRENQIKVMGEFTSNFNAFYNFYSARGKYIAFCEGDDKWGDPLKLQKQVDFLENNPTYAFTFHEFKSIDENEQKISGLLEANQPRKDLSRNELLNIAYHPLLATVCFKKDSLEIPEEIFQVFNVDTFLISLFGEIGDAKFNNDILPTQYRYRTAGLWSKKVRHNKLVAKVLTYSMLAKYFERVNIEAQKRFFLKQMNLHLKMVVISHLKQREFELAGKALVKYMRN